MRPEDPWAIRSHPLNLSTACLRLIYPGLLIVPAHRVAGLNAITVVPWAPNFAAFRRVSSNFERA